MASVRNVPSVPHLLYSQETRTVYLWTDRHPNWVDLYRLHLCRPEFLKNWQLEPVLEHLWIKNGQAAPCRLMSMIAMSRHNLIWHHRNLETILWTIVLMKVPQSTMMNIKTWIGHSRQRLIQIALSTNPLIIHQPRDKCWRANGTKSLAMTISLKERILCDAGTQVWIRAQLS